MPDLGRGGVNVQAAHLQQNAEAGGKPSKGTPKDKRLKDNKAKITKASARIGFYG